MYSPQYSELKALLQKELDIEAETFITPIELLGYFNEGVDMVESAIHTIYEDYFLSTTPLTFVSGTFQYSLPSDIYAQKIRQLWYNDNGSKNYEIRKVKQLSEIQTVKPNDLYKYMLTNSSTGGLKVNIYPTPTESNSNGIFWYIRNAARFTGADTDVCDIPEFTSVVVQYVRWKCMNKEGHPDTVMALQDLANMKQLMVDTLTARVPDEHNEIIQDVSFYNDFDGGGF